MNKSQENFGGLQNKSMPCGNIAWNLTADPCLYETPGDIA